MLLSDELLEIGRSANPKSNLDMHEKAKKMAELAMKKHLEMESYSEKQIKGVFKYVCRILIEEGFSYFTLDRFIFNPNSMETI